MAKVTVGTLTTFNHEVHEWSVYKDRLEQWFLANELDEAGDKSGAKRRAILLSCLTEATYKLARDLALPNIVAKLSYADVVKLFDEHFASTGLKSRERVRNTLSDTSPIRYKFRDSSLSTNESDCLATDSTSKDYFRDNKSYGTQLCTSLVRDEALPYEEEVKNPIQIDTNTKSERFGNCPPAAPVTVLKRNVKGVWTKFKVTAAGEDQMWLTQLGRHPQAPSEASGAAGADGALSGSRRVVQRLLRELIASLPLLPSDANNVKNPKTDRLVKKNRHISGTRSLSSRRSLSVQTLTSTDSQHESLWCEAKPTKHNSKNRGEGGVEPGWAGGARALRDAHVRLVVRQLRHVERLNRALDRRAC